MAGASEDKAGGGRDVGDAESWHGLDGAGGERGVVGGAGGGLGVGGAGGEGGAGDAGDARGAEPTGDAQVAAIVGELATTDDAAPQRMKGLLSRLAGVLRRGFSGGGRGVHLSGQWLVDQVLAMAPRLPVDRKSTRLNSSHV